MRARGQDPAPTHVTRMTPKQRETLLAGGSLYWVIKGEILARQRLMDLRAVQNEAGHAACAFVLDPALIETLPQPRRPFQGWRYLRPEDAPPDQTAAPGMDAVFIRQLSEVGVI